MINRKIMKKTILFVVSLMFLFTSAFSFAAQTKTKKEVKPPRTFTEAQQETLRDVCRGIILDNAVSRRDVYFYGDVTIIYSPKKDGGVLFAIETVDMKNRMGALVTSNYVCTSGNIDVVAGRAKLNSFETYDGSARATVDHYKTEVTKPYAAKDGIVFTKLKSKPMKGTDFALD
jgi:hypothetical protein